MDVPPDFPHTTTGRPVHSAAFEAAVAESMAKYPGQITSEHRDKMLDSIVLDIAAGTTDIGVLVQNALQCLKGAELEVPGGSL
jgi:hypothetical protein